MTVPTDSFGKAGGKAGGATEIRIHGRPPARQAIVEGGSVLRAKTRHSAFRPGHRIAACGPAKFNDETGNAALYEINQWLQQEARQPEGCMFSAFCVLQFLQGASDVALHSRDGSWHYGSHMDNRRIAFNAGLGHHRKATTPQAATAAGALGFGGHPMTSKYCASTSFPRQSWC